MRKLSAIRRKAESLGNAFRAERARRCYEDMGVKYIARFKDFVGDEYSYQYADRLEIYSIQSSLFDLVTS